MMFWDTKNFWAWLGLTNSLLGFGLVLLGDLTGGVIGGAVALGCALMWKIRTE